MNWVKLWYAMAGSLGTLGVNSIQQDNWAGAAAGLLLCLLFLSAGEREEKRMEGKK